MVLFIYCECMCRCRGDKDFRWNRMNMKHALNSSHNWPVKYTKFENFYKSHNFNRRLHVLTQFFIRLIYLITFLCSIIKLIYLITFSYSINTFSTYLHNLGLFPFLYILVTRTVEIRLKVTQIVNLR